MNHCVLILPSHCKESHALHIKYGSKSNRYSQLQSQFSQRIGYRPLNTFRDNQSKPPNLSRDHLAVKNGRCGKQTNSYIVNSRINSNNIAYLFK